MDTAGVPARIFHLALRDEWQEAAAAGTDYRRSTLGRSLDDEAFPHIYGPLPVAAVVRVSDVPVGADGRLVVGPLLGG